MHLPMLERHLHHLFGRLIQVSIYAIATAAYIFANLRAGGPIRWRIGRQVRRIRIDARLKQRIKLRIGALQTQAFAANLNGIETVQVSNVKDYSMPFRNRAVIDGLGRKNFEQFITCDSRLSNFFQQICFSRLQYFHPARFSFSF
jgi:hypothetical protein